MRYLVSTLYVFVFLALFGLGWAIDRYYDSIVGVEKAEPYAGYRAALTLAVNHVTAIIDRPDELIRFFLEQPLKFSLERQEDLPLPPSLSEKRDAGEIIILESDETIGLYLRIPDRDFMLLLEIDQGVGNNNQPLRYWLTLLFYAGVGLLLFLWLAPLLRGINELNHAAGSIGQGKLDTRVKYKPGNYLMPLKTEFNAMAARLERLNENNQLLTQAVSHELRTPLSRMRFGLSMLEGRVDAAQRNRDILRLERDMDTMEALISELLRYARLDKPPTLHYQRVDLEPLLVDRISQFSHSDYTIEFELNNPTLTAHLDPEYFSKVVDNIIQNAYRYADSTVRVSCVWSNQNFTLMIEDDGPGIHEEQYDTVFKPFVRLSGAEIGAKEGFGLGLAIVERIVKWHGARIEVGESDTLGGALFKVQWPITKHS